MLQIKNVTFHRKTSLIENSVFGAFETPHKQGLTAFQTLCKLFSNALQTLQVKMILTLFHSKFPLSSNAN